MSFILSAVFLSLAGLIRYPTQQACVSLVHISVSLTILKTREGVDQQKTPSRSWILHGGEHRRPRIAAGPWIPFICPEVPITFLHAQDKSNISSAYTPLTKKKRVVRYNTLFQSTYIGFEHTTPETLLKPLIVNSKVARQPRKPWWPTRQVQHLHTTAHLCRLSGSADDG